MTPSLFLCAGGPQVAELDIAYGWGSQEAARSVLERHWDTFITQEDFDNLAKIGINTVRLPIGYWSLGPGFLGGTPFEPVADVYRNAWSRVLRAIGMASQAGVGVLVDLHGAVGSQNGQPHSGISDGATSLFTSPDNVAKTLEVLRFLMQQLSYVTNVVGIQILNEPQYVPELENFCALPFVLPDLRYADLLDYQTQQLSMSCAKSTRLQPASLSIYTTASTWSALAGTPALVQTSSFKITTRTLSSHHGTQAHLPNSTPETSALGSLTT